MTALDLGIALMLLGAIWLAALALGALAMKAMGLREEDLS